MTYDVDRFRSRFPSLASGVAHFDGPGGTQTPREVGEAIAATLTGPLSNRGTSTPGERNATAAVEAFRAAFADLLGMDPRGIVYGRSATQLTYDFSRALAKTWGPGDEIVLSRLDHDCNVSPWRQAAQAAGVTVRWLDVDPETAQITPESIDAAIGERTHLVAVTAASNLLGTMPPVRRIADAAHAVGALVYVDGVHYAAHEFVDVAELGADLFVCSPYKFLGPHCGVLAADPALLETIRPDKLAPSTNDVPERFELGTLPYEIMAGATAAVDVLAGLLDGDAPGGSGSDGGEAASDPAGVSRRERLRASFAAIGEHESRLLARIEEGLAGLGDAVVVHSRAQRRTPTLLVTFPGRASADAARHLAERDVHAPASFFYAHELMHRLDLPDTVALRIGLAPYSNDADVDRLLVGLAEFVRD